MLLMILKKKKLYVIIIIIIINLFKVEKMWKLAMKNLH